MTKKTTNDSEKEALPIQKYTKDKKELTTPMHSAYTIQPNECGKIANQCKQRECKQERRSERFEPAPQQQQQLRRCRNQIFDELAHINSSNNRHFTERNKCYAKR